MKGRDRALPADTIAAISTAPGRAGISVVRVSGPDTVVVAERLRLPELAPRRATLAPVHHPEDGRMVDRAVITLHRAPSSYTGEDLLEISGHGGFLVPQLILDAACAAGARLARPGEFTMRAFLNGRMDLVQAEATLDLIDARSEAAHKSALFQLERGLSRRIEGLRDEVIGLLALLAYEIDFQEENDDPVPELRIATASRTRSTSRRRTTIPSRSCGSRKRPIR
jgi:tRNA modification GTPase